MKKVLSVMFLVLISCAVQASADTFSQQLSALAKKVSDKIMGSKLNQSIKSDFSRQLSTIMSDAGCRPATGPDPCASASPSGIQQAEGKLNKLSDAVDQAIKEDASKSMSQIYEARINNLRHNIQAAKVDSPDKQKLERRLSDFEMSLGGKMGRSPSPEDADKTLKAIADDLEAAIALNQKGETLAAGFMAKVNALKKKIEGSKLNPQFKSDFTNQLNAIVNRICQGGPSSAISSGMSKAGGPSNCGGATPTAIEKAEGELTRLEADVDKAVQDDGGKDMSQIYKPLIDALTMRLDKSKVDAGDKRRLDDRIRDFSMLVSSKGGMSAGGSRSGGGQKATPEELQKQFQQLSDDVDAAIRLAETTKSKSFADDFMRKADDVKKKIEAAKLNPALTNDFRNQLSNIVNQAGCAPAGGSSARDGGCPRATPSSISKGETDLAKLSDDLDKAIKADAGKNMAQIYKPQLDAIRDKIGRSKIDSIDKRRLDQALEELARAIQAMGAPGGGGARGGSNLRTPDDVDRAISKLNADVDAAIAMSTTKR